MMTFLNRTEAGGVLAEKLKVVLSTLSVEAKNVVVLGIPRGGVVVAAVVAKVLKTSLDVVVVRKLGVPGHPEFAFGAVDVEGRFVIDEETVSRLGLSTKMMGEVRQREYGEARRREAVFRRGREPLSLMGKTAILVDDGIATGATTESAIRYVKSLNPAKVILAVPVSPPDTVDKLRPLVDEMVVLFTPANFMAVGQFYRDFPQTSDEEVVDLLSWVKPSTLLS